MCVYRPPSLDRIELLLTNIFQENKLIFIAGDINIELLKDNTSKTELLSILNSFNVHQTIFDNTRNQVIVLVVLISFQM